MAGNIVIADTAALIRPYSLTVFMIKMGKLLTSVSLPHTGDQSTLTHQIGPSRSRSQYVSLCLFHSALFSGHRPPLPHPLELYKKKKANILLILFAIEKPSDLTQLLNFIVPQFAHM